MFTEMWKLHWLGNELYVVNCVSYMRKDTSHSNMGWTLATVLTVPVKFIGIYFSQLTNTICLKFSALRCQIS